MRERVVKLLREMSDAMRKAGDRHRVRAYSRAADNVEKRQDFEALYKSKRLQDIAGVGPAIEKKIVDFVEKGIRPDWVDDPGKLPPKLRGSAVTRARADAGGIGEMEDPPDVYFDAPFADAPDLHIHTTWSDGTLSLEETVLWAKRLRAPAVGISDHSARLRIANGLREDEVREQWSEIEALQAKHPEIVILRGTECDIMRDGSLDHGDELLSEFDYVIGSLHSQLKLDKAQQTMRVMRALENEHLTILGHPTTRVPGRRPPANLDFDKIFAKAAERGVAMEVNGNPGRRDLDVPLAIRALAAGCKLSVGSDGHSAYEMLSLAVAKVMVEQAGAKKSDLVNYDVLLARAGGKKTKAKKKRHA